MLNFKDFIIEEADAEQGKKLKHLTHLEDMPIHSGHQGVADAADILDDTHKILTGKKAKTQLSTKYDGAPSLVFGHHPKTGQFFVASKSAFNKDPKINYTDEDIERNHGHAPGLVEKLKAALKHLPKVAPKEGVYQGDVMHTKGDVESHGGKVHFTPNTLTYSADAESPHGKMAKASKIGLVVHTKYKGKNLEDMSATPDVDRENFKHHPDVHNIDPRTKISPENYTPEMQRKFRGHMEEAKRIYSRMKPESLDALKGHEIDLEAHVNDMIRKGGHPSAEGYMNHLTNKMNREVEKVKTPAAKQKKMQAFGEKIDHVGQNKKHFEDVLQLHHHLQGAKNELVDALDKNSEFEHHVGGEKTGAEGFVANRGNSMAKLVKRHEFSRMNLLGMGKMSKKTEKPE